MLRNTLPNTAKLIGMMPIHHCVDQVVDLAMQDYEIAAALRDPTKRTKKFVPLHNASWHSVPSRRQ